jgi:hypothetical protein
MIRELVGPAGEAQFLAIALGFYWPPPINRSTQN